MEEYRDLFAAIFGVISVIVGAVLGAYGTYWFNIRHEHNKLERSIHQLHTILLNEILNHYSSLFLQADRLAPRYLCRGNEAAWEGFDHHYLNLATFNFDSFFSRLLDSPIYLQIADYYRHISVINEFDALASEKHNFSNWECEQYYRDVLNTLNRSVELVDDLLDSRKLNFEYLRPRLLEMLGEWRDERNRHEIFNTLLKYTYMDLFGFYVGNKGLPDDFTEEQSQFLKNLISAAGEHFVP